MPIIKVWCLPKAMTEELLKILCDAIINTVEGIPELGLTGKKGSITVLFPSDRMDYGLGEEIITEVAIFNKPERTDEVRAELARRIGTLLHGYFPSANIECFIYPLERTSGFWKITPHTTDGKNSEQPPVIQIALKEDEQILRLAIERMTKGKQRVINGLANDQITGFSQLKDKPYWRVDRRQYGLGKKTHVEFAKALVANGHECVYTQSCLRKTVPELEQEQLVIRELAGIDWKKILSVPWDDEISPSIKGIQRRNNKPIAIGKAFPSEDRNRAPGHKMNSVNCMFRKAKLPYRLKIVSDVPTFGTIDDRKVQLAVLPKK